MFMIKKERKFVVNEMDMVQVLNTIQSKEIRIKFQVYYYYFIGEKRYWYVTFRARDVIYRKIVKSLNQFNIKLDFFGDNIFLYLEKRS